MEATDLATQIPIQIDLDKPEFVIPAENRIPVNHYPADMLPIPPSRMFLIRDALKKYKAVAGEDALTYDASQGDGGASLPGVHRRNSGSRPRDAEGAWHRLRSPLGTDNSAKRPSSSTGSSIPRWVGAAKRRGRRSAGGMRWSRRTPRWSRWARAARVTS